MAKKTEEVKRELTKEQHEAFAMQVEEVLTGFDVDVQTGLSAEQVEKHRQKYGKNAFTEKKPESFAARVLRAMADPMTIMLILACAITVGVNLIRYFSGGHADFYECIGIFVAITLSTSITVAMEGKSAKAFEALSKLGNDEPVRVLRGGVQNMVAQSELVCGDIVVIAAGDKVPADGRIIDGTSLACDESALTGESVPANKDATAVFTDEKTPVAERRNMLFSGCFVTSGSGHMVVTAVGDDTEFGKIARELSGADTTVTPLSQKLQSMGKKIATLGSIAAALAFIMLLVRYIMTGTASFETISDAFITSIALIVAAVPEGLPTIVAVCLAINVIKMSKQNALVKKMAASETVGCINVICSDKTGTLTQNRMTVVSLYQDGRMVEPSAMQNRAVIANICINSTADVTEGTEGATFIGNPTECAMIVAAKSAGIDYEKERADADVCFVYPFSSQTKNMTTVVRAEGGLVAYSKGSPEKIIAMCQMTGDEKREAEELIRRAQICAQRVIGMSHKAYVGEPPQGEDDRAAIESGMTFDGFVAITDPVREQVPAAVEHCREAGIDIKMLTGDNIVTASAIAKELHILDDGIAVSAPDIADLPDEELEKKLADIRVIARSTPELKMRVVQTLKRMGNVVAVTGDGINDAPALKNADVGLAMGITGTQVSKEASDIVLLDDSFATIVKAVQWGRGIYENFKRFIQFQLTVNVAAVAVVLFAIMLGFDAPFTALQLLWINIIMDGPPALMLGLEAITGDLLKRKPTPRGESIITGGMMSKIIFSGLYITFFFLLQEMTNFLGAPDGTEASVHFTLFVLFVLFNAFNARLLSDESIFKNIKNSGRMALMLLAMFVLQIVITQFGGAFFGTVALSFGMWIKITLLAFTIIPAMEILKAVRRAIAKR